MEIEQSFTVPYPRDAVWARFHDTPGIVACLPGASLTAPVDNGMLKLAMTVKLGPIVASFAGDGEVKVDYTIGGSLAQFSRSGIVKELATRMTEAFADNLKAKLDEAGTAASS